MKYSSTLLILHGMKVDVRRQDSTDINWPCGTCKQSKTLAKTQKWFQCDHFLVWLHYECVGITRKPQDKVKIMIFSDGTLVIHKKMSSSSINCNPQNDN
jgi:hypothetical protein